MVMAPPTGSLATRNSSKFAVLSPSRHQKKISAAATNGRNIRLLHRRHNPTSSTPWSEEIECILDNSLREMPIIGAKDSNPIQQEESANTSTCALCCFVRI
ncbi:hypothetical protein POPTR_013G037665v4 [Populus trichocarpa]|uniref:Uncharacterized protein n=1 Tax=Populus trichocarpa TaxID=3694 RepID=A0ACC0S1V1_POPTR|nr:hypothetical protein POPTR_013G037665v4 [Populus trichocarpa]